MEKKKLLLVAVSVGIFLIIVIGLSILIFLPRNKESVGSSRPVSRDIPITTNTNKESIKPESSAVVELDQTAPATVDAVDMLRNREAIQGLQPPPTVTVAPEPTKNGTGGNNGSSLVIEVQRPSAAAVPHTEPVSRTGSNQNVVPIPQPAKVTPTPPPRSSSSVPATPSSIPRSSSPSMVTASEPLKVSAQSSKSYEDYWIQAGAFSTQVKAQDMKDILASKGITAIIENRDVNGQNFFRVRVGPYTSQNEANYWLAHLKTIGFEDSQIRQTTSQR
jgi:DedD protein